MSSSDEGFRMYRFSQYNVGPGSSESADDSSSSSDNDEGKDNNPLMIAAMESYIQTFHERSEHKNRIAVFRLLKEKRTRLTPTQVATALQSYIDSGADVNMKHTKGNDTLLSRACRFGRLACVTALLDAKANVNLPKKGGATPLYIAAQQNFPECVQILLERGADLHQPTNQGYVPLHIASFHGYRRCMKLLLEAGANVAMTRAQGLKAYQILHYGIELDPKDPCAVIEGYANLKAQTPLYFVAQSSKSKAVSLLLEYRADVNQVPDDAPIHITTSAGDVSCTQVLLEAKASLYTPRTNPNNTASVLGTPFNLLFQYYDCVSNNSFMDFLATEVVEPDSGFTPLMYAASTGNGDAFTLLLEHSSDIAVKDYYGTTAAMLLATTFNDRDVSRILSKWQ